MGNKKIAGSRTGRKEIGAGKRNAGKIILTWIPMLVALAGLILGILSYRDKARAEEAARLADIDKDEQAKLERAHQAKEISRDAMMTLGGPVVRFSERADPVALDRAGRQAEAAYLKDKASPEARVAQAIVARKQGNPKAARSHVDAALKLDPVHPNALIMRGILEQEGKQLKQARDDFEKARQSADTRAQQLEYDVATLNLANVLITEGDADAAKPLLDEAEKNPATQALAYNARGVMSLKSGDLKSAIEEFEKAITADPEYAKALYNQTCALLSAGRFPEAKEYQERLNIRLKAMNKAEQDCSIEQIDIEPGAPKTGFWSVDYTY